MAIISPRYDLDLWPRKPMQQFPITLQKFVVSCMEIPPLSTEILRHVEKFSWPCYDLELWPVLMDNGLRQWTKANRQPENTMPPATNCWLSRHKKQKHEWQRCGIKLPAFKQLLQTLFRHSLDWLRLLHYIAWAGTQPTTYESQAGCLLCYWYVRCYLQYLKYSLVLPGNCTIRDRLFNACHQSNHFNHCLWFSRTPSRFL